MWLSRLWNHSRVSIIIAFGFASAGLGQFIFGLYPSTGFSNENLSILTLWQSISLGVGLMLASPVNGVLFSQLALLKGDVNDPRFSPLLQSLQRLCYIVIALISVVLVLITPFVFDSDYLLVFLLIASLLVQVAASAQRAVLAAQSSWWRFSSQFVIEGIGRAFCTFVVVSTQNPSLKTLITLNVFVQLISVIVPVLGHQWRPKLNLKPLPLRESGRMFLPLWLAALAVQSLLSLAPFLSRTLGQASPIQIAALGGLVQVIRIPVTFSSPLTLPYLNRLAAMISEGSQELALRIIRNVVILLVSVWGSYGLLVMGIGKYADLSAMAYAPVISQKLLLALIATSLACPVAIFLHSYFLLLQRPRIISSSWASALLIYCALMYVIGNTVTGSVLAIASGAISAGIVFYFDLLRSKYSKNLPRNRTRPI